MREIDAEGRTLKRRRAPARIFDLNWVFSGRFNETGTRAPVRGRGLRLSP
jgi:hypothetical protein